LHGAHILSNLFISLFVLVRLERIGGHGLVAATT
jgi:hypothetical protein